MIDDEITFREKRYRSEDLSHGSHKLVWAICEGENCERVGGRGRWLSFKDCHVLCFKCAMKNLPIERCETPTKKRECIDDEKTFREKGYRSTDLKPNSHKKVWAVCTNPDCDIEGGRGRWLMFRDCRDWCCICSSRKNGLSRRGQYPSDETREKMRKAHANFSGENHPMYGKKHTGHSKILISKHKKENISDKTRQMLSDLAKKRTGEKAANWKGGITPENHKFRSSGEYAEWRKSVFERDGYICCECEQPKKVLNAHHILPYRDWRDPQFSLNINNGITLCEDCHYGVKGREYEFFNRYFDIANGISKLDN